MNVSCECLVFSGRGLWLWLITRPEESYRVYVCVIQCEESKGKAIPLQVWTGPEGSGKLKLPDS
jgi:hypothetical protein